MTDDPKKLTPAEIAHVVIEVQPVLNLIEQAAAHMGAVRAAAKILPRWDDEIGQHLAYADAAPEFMKAAIFNGIFLEMSKRHGQTPEFWGALAHEMRRRQAQQPVAELQPLDPPPAATPTPVSEAPRAKVGKAQTVLLSAPEQPKAEPAKAQPAKTERPKLTAEETGRILKVLERCQQTIRLIDGTKKMPRAGITAEMLKLGVKASGSELSRVATGEPAKRVAQGKTCGWTLASANNFFEGLSIIYDTLAPTTKAAM